MSAKNYFKDPKHFHEAFLLHEEKELSYEKACEIAPILPKGWWELGKLEKGVKLEFLRDFWLNALPYLPHIYHFLDTFFAQVNHVGVYCAQKKEKGPFEVYLSYSLKDQFFLGSPPLLEKEIERFKRGVDFPLPEDFLNFLRIHNGFAKGEDTGIFPTGKLLDERAFFLSEIEKIPEGVRLKEKQVNPTLLFPFYRSFGLDIYQCFYKDWYPDGEVGNVLCSLSEKLVASWSEQETLSFPSFLDWLTFYLSVA